MVFFSTVASVLRCGVVVKNFLVMVLNDAAHVRHATVASFVPCGIPPLGAF